MRDSARQLPRSEDALEPIGHALDLALNALERGVSCIVQRYDQHPREIALGAVPFLQLFGLAVGGWQLARSAYAAWQRLQEGAGDAEFYRAKLQTAQFYASHLLPMADGLSRVLTDGGEAALQMDDESF